MRVRAITPIHVDEDIRLSDEPVSARLARTDPAEYDAVLPDCVLDPGVQTGGDRPVPAVVINGCSAVDVAGAGGGPRVVDPTAIALRVLGLLAELGCTVPPRPAGAVPTRTVR